MGKYLKLFDTDSERITYENSQNYIEPYVSYVEGDDSIHYNKPPFFCKLILSDDSVVELEGSGELTKAMVSDQYKNTLVSAEIGKLCSSIGTTTFDNCSGLTSVTIGSGVTSIGTAAFNYCTSLTEIVIPNNVKNLNMAVFYNCSSLTSAEIGNGVTSIGTQLFQGCINLSTITSHIMNAPTVSPGTFANIKSGGTLYVPIGSSGYETWMNDQGNLGYYNWTKVEQ